MELLLPLTDRELLSSDSPYCISMFHPDMSVTRWLIDAGFDVNADCDVTDTIDERLSYDEYWFLQLYNQARASPLADIALLWESADQANALLEAGACPDAVDADHVSPLLVALDQLRMVRMLVSAGATVNVYHPRVIGNLSLLVCVTFLRSLDMMLRCGAEPDSLFRRVHAAEVETSDEANTPMALYDVVVKVHSMMTECGVKLEQVLDRLLQFSSSVSLDDRLADYCSSESEWRQLKTIAGSSSLCACNCMCLAASNVKM